MCSNVFIWKFLWRPSNNSCWLPRINKNAFLAVGVFLDGFSDLHKITFQVPFGRKVVVGDSLLHEYDKFFACTQSFMTLTVTCGLPILWDLGTFTQWPVEGFSVTTCFFGVIVRIDLPVFQCCCHGWLL